MSWPWQPPSRPRLMARRAAIVAAIGLPILLIGFVGMIGDPLPPEDHRFERIRFVGDEIEDGIYLVGLVANDTAVDSTSEDPQLELALIGGAPGTRAELRADDGVTVTVTPRPDWPSSGSTTPVAGCDGNCLQTFEVIVDRAAEDHDVELEFAARIGYQRGRDSVPDGAALGLWVEPPSGSATGTVGSDPVTLLTANDRPRQIRTAVMEMSREHVPQAEIAPDGTLSAVWTSGALLGIVPVDTQATVTLDASERVIVDVSGQRPDRRSSHGFSAWHFELPLTLTCDQTVCRSEWTATLELHKGTWALMGWGNYEPGGLKTEAGTPLPTWTLDGAP